MRGRLREGERRRDEKEKDQKELRCIMHTCNLPMNNVVIMYYKHGLTKFSNLNERIKKM